MARKGQLTTSEYMVMSEFNRLLYRLRKDKKYIWELYCTLSFCTALRSSDVRSLLWSDVLAREAFCITEKKTGKSRIIKFNEVIRKKIKELYNLLGKPEESSLIFKSPYKNKPYSIQHINHLLKKFRDEYELQIKAFSTHSLRKTFGRFVYEYNNKSAESLILLNTILNHRSINTTKVYIGIRQNEIDAVFDSLTLTTTKICTQLQKPKNPEQYSFYTAPTPGIP